MARIWTNFRTFTDQDCRESGERDGRDGTLFYPCDQWELTQGDRLRGQRARCAAAYAEGYKTGRSFSRVFWRHFPESGDTRFDAAIESEIRAFRKLADRYAKACEREHNGDRHPDSPNPDDKCLNALTWSNDAAIIAKQMTAYAVQWGFHHLDFGVGLYPTFQLNDSDTYNTLHFDY